VPPRITSRPLFRDACCVEQLKAFCFLKLGACHKMSKPSRHLPMRTRFASSFSIRLRANRALLRRFHDARPPTPVIVCNNHVTRFTKASAAHIVRWTRNPRFFKLCLKKKWLLTKQGNPFERRSRVSRTAAVLMIKKPTTTAMICLRCRPQVNRNIIFCCIRSVSRLQTPLRRPLYMLDRHDASSIAASGAGNAVMRNANWFCPFGIGRR